MKTEPRSLGAFNSFHLPALGVCRASRAGMNFTSIIPKSFKRIMEITLMNLLNNEMTKQLELLIVYPINGNLHNVLLSRGYFFWSTIMRFERIPGELITRRLSTSIQARDSNTGRL